jgi:hypothetical protein
MVKKISVSYFPQGFLLAVPIGIVLGLHFYYSPYVLAGIIICSMTILTGILTMTTFYITEFDLKRGFYNDYISMLGLVFRHKRKRINKIERIIICPAYYKHTVRFRGAQPYQVNAREFTAYIIHDGNELEIRTMKNKKKLINEIKDIANFFSVDIEDRSVRNPYVVDLKRN